MVSVNQFGTVGLTICSAAADALEQVMKVLPEADLGDDKQFGLIVSHALKFWGVSAKTLAEGVGVGEAQVHQWVGGRVYNGHPTLEDRKRIIKWIESDLRGRAARLRGFPYSAAEESRRTA